MGLSEAEVTDAQKAKGERGIWQPRFWEHTIEDEEDLDLVPAYPLAKSIRPSTQGCHRKSLCVGGR